jgi:aspartyl-tRNA synthetase
MLENAKRTHGCGTLRVDHVGEQALLQGWVHAYRDLGGLVFLTLRDRTGLCQITIDERCEQVLRDQASKLRQEFVVEIEGQIQQRPNPNPKLPTGMIELVPTGIKLLSTTLPLPFSSESALDAHEETRLKYRYLDLRRPALQNNLRTRHKAAQAVRRYLDSEEFLEIETPVLTRATPEGARDYLVPSRVHPGQWYALPQSPQIFKQILMISGLDRYFQIVKCFRDEDLRADRQPEFTQIDIEMSFCSQEMVLELSEGVLRSMWKAVLDYDVPEIPRISYAESMARFGVDAPDTRFAMEHVNLTETLASSESRIIGGAIAEGGIAKGMNVKGAAESSSRKVIDQWTEFVRRYGMGGLMWAKVNTEGWSGPMGKLLSDEEKAIVGEALGAEIGDVLLLGVGAAKAVHAGLGRLRAHLGKTLALFEPGGFSFCWVLDFPGFEWDEEANRFAALHHPFTAPKPGHEALLGTGREGEMLSDAHDLVCNGYEIAGGSIRIHSPEVQENVFTTLGFSSEEAADKFGFLVEALRNGAPPHGGIAFGFDRCAMLLCGTENIRDVIAFPKTTTAQCLMSEAPSSVSVEQLDELHVQNKAPKA